jgi:hypothetical protein
MGSILSESGFSGFKDFQNGGCGRFWVPVLDSRNYWPMEMGTILKNYYSRVVNKKICMKGVVQVGFYFNWPQHKYFDPSEALRTGCSV